MSQGVDPPPEPPQAVHVNQLNLLDAIAEARGARDARIERRLRKYAHVDRDNDNDGSSDDKRIQPTRRLDRW